MADTAFSVGMRIMFAQPDLHIANSVYTPLSGASKSVSVIKRQEDETIRLLTTGARQSAVVFDVLVEEIPVRPANGDLLTVDTVQYRIRSAEPDELGLVWQLDVEPV